MRSDRDADAEVIALWTAVFGGPPPVVAPRTMFLDYIVSETPTPVDAIGYHIGPTGPRQAPPTR